MQNFQRFHDINIQYLGMMNCGRWVFESYDFFEDLKCNKQKKKKLLCLAEPNGNNKPNDYCTQTKDRILFLLWIQNNIKRYYVDC